MPLSRDHPTRRRDYRHFPEAYSAALFKFSDTGGYALGPMSKGDCEAARRDLYRFKMMLTAAVDDGDEYAGQLLDIFKRVVLKIEPCVVPTPAGDFILTFALNPIVAAMEAAPREDDREVF